MRQDTLTPGEKKYVLWQRKLFRAMGNSEDKARRMAAQSLEHWRFGMQNPRRLPSVKRDDGRQD